MASSLRRMTGALALLSLATLPLAAQGLFWEMTISHKDGPEQLSRFYYSPGKYKILPDQGMASIIRLDTERLLMIDYAAKRYHEMTFAQMEAMIQEADMKMAEMQRQLENLPPDQRKMVEDMMGDRLKTAERAEKKIDVVNTGEHRRISGYACTRYVVREDGNEKATIWATKGVPGYATIWKEMAKDLEEFGKKMVAITGLDDSNILEGSRHLLDGFPVQTITKEGTTMTVTTVDRRSIGTAEFEVPKGFTKETAPAVGDADRE